MIKAYNKQKAHEYYMKHRKLKGKRKAKPKATGGSISQRKNKKRKKWVAPKSASYTTVAKVGKGVKYTDDDLARLRGQLDAIKKRLNNLPPEKKTALKSALSSVKEKRKKGKK